MSPLVFTPSTVDATGAELLLSDGHTALDLLGSPPWGLYLVELTIPVPARENAYVRKAEGQSRIRSQPQNGAGTVRLRIDRADPEAVNNETLYQADLAAIQTMVGSAHDRKGTIIFTPPRGERVTYDIESIQFTEAPADGVAMSQYRTELVVEFECLPWGRRESINVFSGEALNGPIDGIEIPSIAGAVDAWGELTLTDTSSAVSDFVEFGLGQKGYDPDADINLDYGVEESLTASVEEVVETGDRTHGGVQKISALLSTASADVWVRFAWRIDEGALSYGRWINVPPDASALRELTLAVIDMGGSTHWDGFIEAFAGTGSGAITVHNIFVIPAQVNGRIRLPNAPANAMAAGKSTRFTHEGGFRQQTGMSFYAKVPLDGDTLTIPVSANTGLPVFLVVRRRTNDIDSGLASAGRTDDVTASLTITPRVPLF